MPHFPSKSNTPIRSSHFDIKEVMLSNLGRIIHDVLVVLEKGRHVSARRDRHIPHLDPPCPGTMARGCAPLALASLTQKKRT